MKMQLVHGLCLAALCGMVSGCSVETTEEVGTVDQGVGTAAMNAGPCVVAEINRTHSGSPTGFKIILNNLDIQQLFWSATYQYRLGSRGALKHGWIGGDRAGYQGAYMFLVEWTENAQGKATAARVLGRVSFARATDEAGAYTQVNDAYMNEIQTTGIAFDGKCDGKSQGEQPFPMTSIAYTPSDAPEVRPIVHFVDANGALLADRSYTNTVSHKSLRFSELSRTRTPFQQTDGFGDSHTVYGRVTVLARFDDDGDGKDFLPVVAVYYDSLVPDVSIDP